MTGDIYQKPKLLFFRNFSIALVYVVGFFVLQYVLYKSHIVSYFPNESNLTHWDASWYKSIVDKGYQFNINSQSNTGFYYLFPAIWGLCHASVYGISGINIIFFIAGFSLLSLIYRPRIHVLLLWLTFPAVFYTYIPYSEALFFLLSTISLWGIHSGNRLLTWVALFLLSLTRATAIMLMPAFLLMELISNDKKEWRHSAVKYFIYFFLPMLAGLIVFILIQFRETGVWFAYAIQQSQRWGHKLNQPEFPLRCSVNPGYTWLAALIVFSCGIATFLLIKIGKQWLKANEMGDKILLISLGYMAMSLFLLLFINVPSELTGSYRYVMANPFFYVFIFHFTHKMKYCRKDYLLVFLIATLVWLLFSYKDYQLFLLLSINTAIIFLFMLTANRNLLWPYIVLSVINLFFQIQLYQQFLGGGRIMD